MNIKNLKKREIKMNNQIVRMYYDINEITEHNSSEIINGIVDNSKDKIILNCAYSTLFNVLLLKDKLTNNFLIDINYVKRIKDISSYLDISYHLEEIEEIKLYKTLYPKILTFELLKNMLKYKELICIFYVTKKNEVSKQLGHTFLLRYDLKNNCFYHNSIPVSDFFIKELLENETLTKWASLYV